MLKSKATRSMKLRLKSAMAAIALLSLAPSVSAETGRLESRLNVSSKALGRPISYSLYSPPLGREGSTKLPVLYLLHGHSDDERAWIEYAGIVPILDRLISSGALRPLFVVMPSAGDSWYVDDARPIGMGAVSRALTTDLIEGIETKYPMAARCRAARAIGGLSMGGFGAMTNALHRSDLFGAVISLSGTLYSDLASDVASRRNDYERIYDGVFGIPFDAEQYLKWNVFSQLARTQPGQVLPAAWLAAGDRDYSAVLSGTIRMHEELNRRGVPNELRILEGEHDWKLWKAAIEPALVWLSANIHPLCPEQ